MVRGPAENLRGRAPRLAGLCVITDHGLGEAYVDTAARALVGGADIIQLRDKAADDVELVERAWRLRRLTAEAGRLLIINDRLDIALAVGADGVHLGEDDTPIDIARGWAEKWSGRSKWENVAQSPGCKADESRGEGAYTKVRDRAEAEDNPGPPQDGLGLVGWSVADGVFGRASRRVAGVSPFIIGASAGTVGAALAAQEAGADYLGVGPVFATNTKHDTRPVIGLTGLEAICTAVEVPVIAIGGIGPTGVPEVMRAGAGGVAVISAVSRAADSAAAAAQLKEMMNKAYVRHYPENKHTLSCLSVVKHLHVAE